MAKEEKDYENKNVEKVQEQKDASVYSREELVRAASSRFGSTALEMSVALKLAKLDSATIEDAEKALKKFKG